MDKDNKNTTDDNTRRLIVGLTMNGDGDLLHLSEGISNDLAYLYEDIRS